FFQAEDGIRDGHVTGVQTCALPISAQKAVTESAVSFRRRWRVAVSFVWVSKLPRETWPTRRGLEPGGPESMSSARRRRPVASERSEERRVGKEGRSVAASEH